MRKGIIICLIIIFIGSLATQNVAATSSVQHIQSPSQRYLLTFIHLKDGHIRNMSGFFFGIPFVKGIDIMEAGVGSFGFTLEGNISLGLRHPDIRDCQVRLKGFIGFFYPTVSISDATLAGFALSVQTAPLAQQEAKSGVLW